MEDRRIQRFPSEDHDPEGSVKSWCDRDVRRGFLGFFNKHFGNVEVEASIGEPKRVDGAREMLLAELSEEIAGEPRGFGTFHIGILP